MLMQTSVLRDGILSVRSGDKVKAKELLQLAIVEDPRDETPWLWLSSIAAGPQEAIDCLRKALHLKPGNPYAKDSLVRMLLKEGIAAAQQQRRTQARSFLDEVLRIDPRSENALMWRAAIEDVPERGAKLLETVLTINPGNLRAKQGLAHFKAQLAPKWFCPFCQKGESKAPGPICNHCKAIVSLANPMVYDFASEADPVFLKQVEAKVTQAIQKTRDAYNLTMLALCYFNLGYRNEALKALHAASNCRGADASLKSIVKDFAKHLGLEDPGAISAASKDILVVDDSLTIQKIVSKTLGAVGYKIATVSGGHDAIDWIQASGAPRMFILDVNMPDMNGFQLCKTLRHSEATATTPVIFLTGKGGLINKLHGQWVGATEYLVKPFDPLVLVSTVQRLLPLTANTRS